MQANADRHLKEQRETMVLKGKTFNNDFSEAKLRKCRAYKIYRKFEFITTRNTSESYLQG